MKRFLSIVLVAILMLGCISLPCFAKEGTNLKIKQDYYNYLVQKHKLDMPFDESKIQYRECDIIKGYLIAVFRESYFGHAAVMIDYNIAGYIFSYTAGDALLAYKEGRFYTLDSLYSKNIFTRRDIANLYLSQSNIEYYNPNSNPQFDASLDYVYTLQSDSTVKILKHFVNAEGSETVTCIPEKLDGKTVSAVGRHAYEISAGLHNVYVFVPDTVKFIDNFAFSLGNKIIIRGKAGSYAEKYVKERNSTETAYIKYEFQQLGTFKDVSAGSWYYDSVYYSTISGKMNGYKNGLFGPADKLKRQDFAIILAHLADYNAPVSYKLNPFKDASYSSYYYPYLSWAYENNIIYGYENGNFGVDDPITREQLCTILFRYYGSPETENIEEILSVYKDRDNISDYAVTATAWCVDQGIIRGLTDSVLGPTEYTSRAQVARIIMSICENHVS